MARPQGVAFDIGAYEYGSFNQFTVTNTADSGPGSLRQAMLDANATANAPVGPDQILFSIVGTGPHTITPASPLPIITEAVIIDGANGIILSGVDAGSDAHGLTLAAGGSSISGLTITGFAEAGVAVLSGTNNRIYNNSIYNNGGQAIDLGGDGVSANDPGDADTGPNNLQNFPVLWGAVMASDGVSAARRPGAAHHPPAGTEVRPAHGWPAG